MNFGNEITEILATRSCYPSECEVPKVLVLGSTQRETNCGNQVAEIEDLEPEWPAPKPKSPPRTALNSSRSPPKRDGSSPSPDSARRHLHRSTTRTFYCITNLFLDSMASSSSSFPSSSISSTSKWTYDVFLSFP
nr:hypothetical protein CFP56_61693 [Quercus suber]